MRLESLLNGRVFVVVLQKGHSLPRSVKSELPMHVGTDVISAELGARLVLRGIKHAYAHLDFDEVLSLHTVHDLRCWHRLRLERESLRFSADANRPQSRSIFPGSRERATRRGGKGGVGGGGIENRNGNGSDVGNDNSNGQGG